MTRNTDPKVWRLISDPPRAGIVNMAIDEWLLFYLNETPSSETIVRFYEWERPTLSLGQHQKMENACDGAFCRSRGIDIVLRPTGGRAVLHDRELTYAVISNDRDTFNSNSVLGTYKRIATALCRGLQRLGVEAVLADTPLHTLEAPENPITVKHPCFYSPSRYELMVGQKKLVGSAQRRLPRSFLQHGSLLMDCDVPMLARATRADTDALRQKITTLSALLGSPVNRSTVETALIQGFLAEFPVQFNALPITEDELASMIHPQTSV
jgi:lipoate-protein ligase A